jgi:hypothetical protein
MANLTAFFLIGNVFYKLLKTVDISRGVVWLLWFAFILTPYMLEQIVWVRKDLVTLAVTLLALNEIYRRRIICIVASYVILIAALRLPQAALVIAFYLIYEVRLRNLRVARLLNISWAVLIPIMFTLVLIAAAYLPELDVAPESLAAFLSDQPQTVGMSSILLSNSFGVAIYAILYPFPRLLPNDFSSLVNTLFAYLHLFFLAAIVYNIRNMQRYEPLLYAAALTFFIALAGYSLTAIMSWNYFGFVIIESRYKLFATVFLFILFARLLRNAGAKSRF